MDSGPGGAEVEATLFCVLDEGGCGVICRSQNFPWSAGVGLYHVVHPALGPCSPLTGKLD